MTDFNVDDLVRNYLAGESVAELARQLKIPATAIQALLRKRDIKLRSRAEARRLSARQPRSHISRAVLSELIFEYCSGKTTGQLAEETGISRSVIYSRLRKAGVQFRDNRESLAIAAGRPETLVRKSRAQKARFARMTTEEREAMAYRAYRRLIGTKQTADYKRKTAAGRQKHMAPRRGPGERRLLKAICQLGIQVTPQKAIGPYNIDIALESYRVAVEIENGNILGREEHPSHSRKRLKYILDQGWSVLYIIVRGQYVSFTDVLDKVLTFAKLAGRNETFCGQYGMIRSNGQRHPRSSLNFDGVPRVPGF